MGHGAPDVAAVLGSWRPHLWLELAVVVVTVGYLGLVRRHARAGLGGRSPRRIGSWLLAMVLLVVAVDGPVGVYADVLFWVHMAQHLLLIMVVPVLLLWAQPLRLLDSVAPTRLHRVLQSRLARWLASPVFGLAFYTAVVVLTHLTGFQQASATHPAIRAFELTLFLVAGWLFFLPLVGAERVPWRPPFLLRFVLLALAMGADTLTGVVLMLTRQPLAPAYAATHPGWGPAALADQQAAGAIMWFGGDLLMMLLMIMVAVQWGRAGSEGQGLGGWLETARSRAVLGGEFGAGTEAGTESGMVSGADLDEDQRALDSYNAMLAALHNRGRRPDGGPTDGSQRRDRATDSGPEDPGGPSTHG